MASALDLLDEKVSAGVVNQKEAKSALDLLGESDSIKPPADTIVKTPDLIASEAYKQAESEKALIERLPRSVFKNGIKPGEPGFDFGMKPEDFYGGTSLIGLPFGLYTTGAQAA